MAEGFLSSIVGEILVKLSSQASQQLGMLCRVEDDLTKLTSSISAIKALLLDAEEHRTKSHSIKDWLKKLKDALYDADDVLDEFLGEALRREVMTIEKRAKQVRIFFSRSNQVAFDYRMTCKIKNVRERLDVIATERNKFHLNDNFEQRTRYSSFDQIGMRVDTYFGLNEEEVIGREDDKKVLKDILLDMNVKYNVLFIAIVGMGGIGKTTLVRSLFNDREVSNCFQLKMWICVSDQFDVKLIMEKMIESATNNNPNVQTIESLQSKLQSIIREKKYLLVMDDVWNESEEKWFHLKNLLIGGARGSKILITKRDNILHAEIANMTSLFTLKGLSKSNSWSLFRKVAFKEGKEPINVNLIQLGKEILVKCKGVPIVIRHIGRLLYFKTSEDEWTSFKNNELLEAMEQENDMTSVFNVSYNHLPPNLKQCFAYSSLFSKNHVIKKDQLIQQWVAQGFVRSQNGSSKSTEDIGNGYFMELCSRFFYEQSNEYVSGDVLMHDLMRDLARMVVGHEYVFGNFKYDDIGPKTRHVSFVHKIKSWQDIVSKLRKAKGLRTFLLPYNPYERKEINEAALDELFSSCSCLRVLDLQYSNIKTVPSSIKKLRHLRYLDLSKNENMKLLPNSVTELQNLQTLNLKECCALKELPRDTSNLVNLRHLDISYPNQLTHMPERMGKLTCLQTLSSFVLGSNKHGSKLSEINGLNHLKGRLHIRGLEHMRSSPFEATSTNLKDKEGLKTLMLQWKSNWNENKAQDGFNDEMVLEGLQPHPNIECLGICGYDGVRLPNWMSNLLLKLTEITISFCHRLQHLPQLNNLPSLKYLSLMNITSLKFIDKNDPFSSSVFFPSLEKLYLLNMPNLEGWWERKSDVTMGMDPTFPRLVSLLISSCPKLVFMPKCKVNLSN